MEWTWIVLVYALCILGASKGFLFEDSQNTACPHARPLPTIDLRNHGDTEVMLLLYHSVLVEKINVVMGDCPERVLAEVPVTIQVISSDDWTNATRMINEAQYGEWSSNGYNMEYTFPQPLFTRHISMNMSLPSSCARFEAFGCEVAEMCLGHEEMCSHVGTCTGADRCACPYGWIGGICDKPFAKLVVDHYDPILLMNKTLYTESAVFDVTGDVRIVQISRKRDSHHDDHHDHHHHTSYCGGSQTYSSHHHNSYNPDGHSSHSPHSSFGHPHGGYSYSTSFTTNDHHHHDDHHYLYTTHGGHHHHPGSSLSYTGNTLEMHHHEHHHDHHGHHEEHHHHVSVPFTPQPGSTHHVTCTYHPQTGAAVYVNGHLSGSQVTPHVKPSSGPQTGSGQQPLCMGNCAPSGKPNATLPAPNITQGNTVVTGASVSQLVTNNALGTLGLPMMNALLPNQGTPPTQPVQSTTTAATTTRQPTTTLPVTATSPRSLNSAGPLCFTCEHQARDGDCKNITQCSSGEICAAFKDQRGYYHRCIEEQKCLTSQATGIYQCWTCCYTDHCNDHCQSSSSHHSTKPTAPPTTTPPVTTTTTAAPTTTTTTPPVTTAACKDTFQCVQLKQVGYKVCDDAAVAKAMCPKTCNLTC